MNGKLFPIVQSLHMRILYLLTQKKKTHTLSCTSRERQASLEPYANRHHQSAKCVRDYRDSKTEWTLNRSNIHLHLCHLVCWAEAHVHTYTKKHKQFLVALVNQTVIFINDVND